MTRQILVAASIGLCGSIAWHDDVLQAFPRHDRLSDASVQVQASPIVRWGEPGTMSALHGRKDSVLKQLSVGAVTIAASPRDRGDSLQIEITIHNAGLDDIDVIPEDLQFHLIEPKARRLASIPAPVLAERVTREANRQASKLERSQAMLPAVAVTVTDLTVTPGLDPISGLPTTTTTTTSRIEYVGGSTPDYAARTREAEKAAAIRADSQADADRLIGTALARTRLTPGSRVSGTLLFERSRSMRQFVLRIPLGTRTIEIPFKVGLAGLFTDRLSFG